jgi:hypothetical protein
LEAAKAKLAAARDAGDIIDVNLMLNKKLQKLGYEAARLQEA